MDHVTGKINYLLSIYLFIKMQINLHTLYNILKYILEIDGSSNKEIEKKNQERVLRGLKGKTSSLLQEQEY